LISYFAQKLLIEPGRYEKDRKGKQNKVYFMRLTGKIKDARLQMSKNISIKSNLRKRF
jgi:hypothetical protein